MSVSPPFALWRYNKLWLMLSMFYFAGLVPILWLSFSFFLIFQLFQNNNTSSKKFFVPSLKFMNHVSIVLASPGFFQAPTKMAIKLYIYYSNTLIPNVPNISMFFQQTIFKRLWITWSGLSQQPQFFVVVFCLAYFSCWYDKLLPQKQPKGERVYSPLCQGSHRNGSLKQLITPYHSPEAGSFFSMFVLSQILVWGMIVSQWIFMYQST